MAGEFAPTSVRDTRLWKRLSQPFDEEATTNLSRTLTQLLPDVCRIASDRMKLMPAFHEEFTLHDDTHLLRVTELMARVMPDRVLEKVLNPIEIALLILAAHFHDVGMIVDAQEASRIRESGNYTIARQNWLIEYAGFKNVLQILEDREANANDRDRSKRVAAEFEQAIFARYLRDNHALQSAAFVKSCLGKDERLRVGTGHLADSLALLCRSHNLPPERITDAEGFHFDKAIGAFPANLAYLAIVLRLADILDFDRERTPDELYRSISFTNSVSIEEWEKHRQIDGWKIDRDAVRFECSCERPEYERAIRRFLRFIDDELAAAHDLVRRFPKTFEEYTFDLPARTDSSRVQAKDGAYLYTADLEISLSRDEIMRLLMTEKLYGHPSLAIRELLQNAWDALRHRKAIVMRDDGLEWNRGQVEFEHGVDADDREFVRCIDNGVGMDERIVKNFLVRAGRSYYRSPEFDRERLTFAQANADFDPCARFGIGFMSLFMLGDRIMVRTRRYRGSSEGLGDPLEIEINGVDSLIVLRKGSANQPAGTSVEVIGRRKPERFLTWKDRVRLVDTLYSYALAGEFPVYAKCSIKEIEDEIKILAGIAEPWHPLVEFDVKGRAIFEQAFSEIDPRMGGKVMCGVPLTEDGRLAVSTPEAGWRQDVNRGPSYYVTAAERSNFWSWGGRTCLDGILVAGPHGRGRRGAPLVGYQYRNPIHLGQDLFVLDVRGELKPELKPDRSPPDDRGPIGDQGPTWRRLQRLTTNAHGLLWESVIDRFRDEADAKALWQLLALHQVQFSFLRKGFVWSRLLIPSLTSKGTLFFRNFSQLNAIPFGRGTPEPFAPDYDGQCVGLDAEMMAWESNKMKLVPRTLRNAVMGMATLALRENAVVLEFNPPEHSEELGFTSITFNRFDSFSKRPTTITFGAGFEGILAAVTSERVLNKRHAITTYLLSKQETSLDEPEFSFLHCLACAMTENGALEAFASGDFANTRFNEAFSSLGYFFKNVDLCTLRTEHRPPYKCWLADRGIFEITEATLAQLAEIQMIDWSRHKEPRHL